MTDASSNNMHICRLCLKLTRKSISLFNNRNVESLRMNKIVQQLCSIELNQDEPFPKCICYTCKMKVIHTYEFVNTCKESDKTLRKIYYMTNDTNVGPDQGVLQINKQDEEGTEMEIECLDDTFARTRSLRSNTKIALIASLPLSNTNECKIPVKQDEDKKEGNNLSDQESAMTRENFNCEETSIKDKHREKVEKEPKEEQKSEIVKNEITEENKSINPVIKREFVSSFEDNQSNQGVGNKNENAEVENPIVQVTIKEEVMISDTENENLKEPSLEYQMESEDCNQVVGDVEVDVEIKEEPSEEEPKSQKELNPGEKEKGDDGIYKLVVNDREEAKFKRKIQYEELTNPNIMYKKAKAALEPGLFHKITSCPICNRVYDRKGNLYNHLKLQHNLLSMKEVHTVLSSRKEMVVREVLSCNMCNKNFESKFTFNDHQTQHPGHMMQVQCENCKACFTSLNSKRRHQQLSCNKPYECLFCSTKFRTFKDFRFHMNTHKN